MFQGTTKFRTLDPCEAYQQLLLGLCSKKLSLLQHINSYLCLKD